MEVPLHPDCPFSFFIRWTKRAIIPITKNFEVARHQRHAIELSST